MPGLGVARFTDKCTYHDAKNTQGSPDVLVNGLGVHRVTDLWGNCACIKLVTGCPTVIINGLQGGRCRDFTYITAMVASCSPDTLYGA